MIDSDALKCIECAVPHTCAKQVNGSQRCAQCEVGYCFIVCEPITLKCGHFVCKECKTKAERPSEMKCKICNEKLESTGANGTASDVFVKMYLKDLTSQLRDKHFKTLNQFEGNTKRNF